MKLSIDNTKRCHWCSDDPLYKDYHDNEWGVPCFDEQKLFEMLILEGMQAGLSWITILKKRQSFRQAFAYFNVSELIHYNQSHIDELMLNPHIIRNRLKINAIITNAKAFLMLKDNHNSFTDYLWQFVNNEPIQNHWQEASEVPTRTNISDHMAKDLKKRGFKFVGTTICYAFMQAVGMVNDHTTHCFLYQKKERDNQNAHCSAI